jgi:hypothetical protein
VAFHMGEAFSAFLVSGMMAVGCGLEEIRREKGGVKVRDPRADYKLRRGCGAAKSWMYGFRGCLPSVMLVQTQHAQLSTSR